MPTPITIPDYSSAVTIVKMPFSSKKPKVQVDLFGCPCVSSTTRVHVASYTKKNGTYVSHHTRYCKRNATSTKVLPKKKFCGSLKAKLITADCKENTALAHSLHIQELQHLMHR